MPVRMSSAAVPVENIPGIVKAIPGSGENCSPSPRNRCSPSARNRFHVHPGILFAFARNPHPYSEKSERLLAVYGGAPDNDIPDLVLYSLLRGRAIQEFNCYGWYGVHPLVVDI